MEIGFFFWSDTVELVCAMADAADPVRTVEPFGASVLRRFQRSVRRTASP